MVLELSLRESVFSSLLTILLATFVVYLAARWVLDRSSFWASLLTAILATLLATFVWSLVGGTLGIVLAAAAWALVAALFFRTEWIKGAIVGLVAWVLWFAVNWAIDALR